MNYQPGQILLDQYRIESLAGRGAFAEVYRAWHQELHVVRALKVLRRDAPGVGSTTYQEFAERFQLEAVLGAKLLNPHIVRVHDFGREEDFLVLVMEFAHGGNLHDLLELKRPELLPVKETLQIAIDVAQGLGALHDMAIVHRDLKPSNILFDAQGRAKVADLGLAQVPGGPSRRSQFSQSGPHPGTPGYMSPEQSSLSNLLKPPSDVYALGLILFEMLTGRKFSYLKPGILVRDLRSDLAEDLVAALQRMLSHEPDRRPWDGNETAALLLACLEAENQRQYEAQRLAQITSLQGEVESLIQEQSFVRAEQALDELAELGREGKETARGLRSKMLSVQQTLKQEIDRYSLAAGRAIQRRKWDVAAADIASLAGLGKAARLKADELHGELERTRRDIDRQREQVEELYRRGKVALAEDDLPTVEKAIQELHMLGRDGQAAGHSLARQRNTARSQEIIRQGLKALPKIILGSLLLGILVAGSYFLPGMIASRNQVAEEPARLVENAPANLPSPSPTLSTPPMLRPALENTTTPDESSPTAASTANIFTMTLPATETPVPTLADTATPTQPSFTGFPALAGTPPLLPAEPISPESASLIQELARWGLGQINDIAYSPDGMTLAITTSNDVYIFNAETLEKLQTLNLAQPASSLAYSPDGEQLAVGLGMDYRLGPKLIKVFYTSDWNIEKTLPTQASIVRDIAYSPDGTMLTFTTGNKISILDNQTGKMLSQIDSPASQFIDLAISPDGRLLAAVSSDKSARVWQYKDRKLLYTLTAYPGSITSLAFSPDSSLLATGTTDATIRLWNMADGTRMDTLKGHTNTVENLAFSPAGQILASSSWQETILWDVPRGIRRSTIWKPATWGFAFSPTGKSLAIANREGMQIWDIQNENLLAEVSVHGNIGEEMAISPDVQYVATDGRYTETLLWNIADGELQHEQKVHNDDVRALAISPDGQTLATGSNDYTVRLWRLPDFALLKVIKAHKYYVNRLAFSPDGKFLATGGADNDIHIWRVDGGTRYDSILGEPSGLLQYSPDGQLLISTSSRQAIVWRAIDGARRYSINLDSYVIDTAFSPDSQVLVVALYKTIVFLRTSDGERIGVIRPLPSSDQATIMKIVLSPDGLLLALGASDGTIRLWRVVDEEEAAVYKTCSSPIDGLAFSADGNLLVSLCDGTISLWGIP